MSAKIALVTGGSRGLGKDMALSLARKNIDVIITYKSSVAEAEGVVKEIRESGKRAVSIQYDSSDLKSLDPFIENIKSVLRDIWHTDKFDFLVNNAGIGANIPFTQVTEADFDKFLNIHYKSVFFLTQKALPLMNDHGGIVFISSGTTRFSNAVYSAYAPLKGAIEVLSRYIAMETGPRGIRSNVVAPGPIETDFNNAGLRNNPQRKESIASRTALGRVGQADDIGNVVAFLCTDDAKWVNGQRIEVTGGINL
jgi:NAD(P)-dependent dehydrogenase (short-subunit alcohol dehydrogenase family)